MKIKVLTTSMVQQSNWSLKAVIVQAETSTAGWVEMELHESIWGGGQAFPLANILPMESNLPFAKTSEKALLAYFFLFRGVKECSAVIKTRMDCPPEKCEHSILMTRGKVSNLYIYKSLELELNPDSHPQYTQLISCKFLYFNL